jgi:serine/threonine protein kinase
MSKIVKEGKGAKQTASHRWKSHWFVLQDPLLAWFDKKNGECKRAIDVSQATTVAVATPSECPKQPSLKISLRCNRTYYIQFPTRQDVTEWVAALQSVQPQLTLTDLHIVRVIGRGARGKVTLVRSKVDQRLFALKSFRKSDETTIQRSNFHHPFLVMTHSFFESNDEICVVLDYVPGGDLFSRLRDERHFLERRTRLYAAEILLAIGFLHENGVVCRDFKPENILVDGDGHLRLSEVGLVKPNISSRSVSWNPESLAPEILRGSPCTKSADWWSYGALVYEMLCGIPPFYDENTNRMSRMILNDPVSYPQHVSAQARDLIGKLLAKEPSRRLGDGERDYLEIKAHEFFAGIDWEALLRKEIEPEWKPTLREELEIADEEPDVRDWNHLQGHVNDGYAPMAGYL